MKKLVFFAILGLAALVSLAPVQAQVLGQYGGFATPMGASTVPSATTPEQVAMLYHVLVARRPDYRTMALASAEYKAANDFDKASVLEAKINSLRNNFEMTSPNDKLIVRMPVTVSSFSVRNQGFIINELADNMNFKFSYCGRDYALITQGLGEAQWIDASDAATALAIDKARGKDNAYTLFITVSPNYADQPERLTELEDGKKYSILTGPTDHIALYDAAGKEQVWTNVRKADPDPMSDDLLKLKQ